MSTLFIKKGTFNHCGRSTGLEQYTSWKVHMCVYIYIYMFTYMLSDTPLVGKQKIGDER